MLCKINGISSGECANQCSMALALVYCSIEADQGGTVFAIARVSVVSWEGGVLQYCLWIPLVIHVRGQWAKCLGYYSSIIICNQTHESQNDLLSMNLIM